MSDIKTDNSVTLVNALKRIDELERELESVKASASGEVEPVAWDDPAVDPMVSKLYQKFKDWSQRGFTADDVTWCEVRGYVAELMNAHLPAKVPEGLESLVREAEEACQDDDNQTMRESALAQKWLNSLNAAIALLTTPTPATTPETEWLPVDKAPVDGETEVILGWWEAWPKKRWRQEIGVAGDMRPPRGRGWLHGRATHFQVVPNPPQEFDS